MGAGSPDASRVRIRSARRTQPSWPRVRTYLVPVGAAVEHGDGVIAADHVDHRVAAAGAAVHFQERIGHDHFEKRRFAEAVTGIERLQQQQ